jgi:hypothetical protein
LTVWVIVTSVLVALVLRFFFCAGDGFRATTLCRSDNRWSTGSCSFAIGGRNALTANTESTASSARKIVGCASCCDEFDVGLSKLNKVVPYENSGSDVVCEELEVIGKSISVTTHSNGVNLDVIFAKKIPGVLFGGYQISC